MHRPFLLALALALAATGCGYNRVVLSGSALPDQSAPLQARVKAYRKFAIQNGQQTTYLRNGVPQGTNIDFVLLGDGTRVEDARDLAPLVDTDSSTGKFISSIERSMETSKRVATGMAIASAALLAVGLGVGLPLMANQECFRGSCSNPTGPLGIAILATGAGLGYLGFNIWPFIAIGANYGNGPDRSSAFLTYNQSLRERLALDDDSLEVEQEQRASPRRPSTFLIPAATLWLAQLTP